MGDRPFVIKPYHPLTILPNQTTTIYVTTAAWLSVAIGKGTPTTITRIAIQQPSDTWMGPNNMQGELCYASRTAGRLDINLLPKKPFRVFTEVSIKNATASPFLLEKFMIPAPNLGVFSSEDNSLWTETVHIERTDQDSQVKVILGKSPPQNIGQVTFVNSPLMPLKSSTLVGRVSQIFG
jgi:hypothetical protein